MPAGPTCPAAHKFAVPVCAIPRPTNTARRPWRRPSHPGLCFVARARRFVGGTRISATRSAPFGYGTEGVGLSSLDAPGGASGVRAPKPSEAWPLLLRCSNAVKLYYCHRPSILAQLIPLTSGPWVHMLQTKCHSNSKDLVLVAMNMTSLLS